MQQFSILYEVVCAFELLQKKGNSKCGYASYHFVKWGDWEE